MQNSLKKQNQAYDLLKEYTGKNSYILKLRRDVFENKNVSCLTDFNIDYIIKNYNYSPQFVSKTVGLVDWFSKKKQEEWKTEFVPNKINISWVVGETQQLIHGYVQYRKSVEHSLMFIPKKALMSNIFAKPYNTTSVDFNRYDNLASLKDSGRKVKEHQKEAVKFLISRKKCILADDMGFGKSLELTIASIEGNFDSVIIICPASIKTNWKKELSWYVNERDITIVESLRQKNKTELEQFLGYSIGKSNKSKDELLKEANEIGKWKDNRYVIVNYDILDEFYQIPKSRSKENIEIAFQNSPLLKFISKKKSLIIIDEAHRLSNNTSIRYKIIKDLIKRGEPDSIYLATGTPVTNNPQNLYCLLQLIENEVSDDWEYYMNRYCGAMKIPAKGEKERWTNYYLYNHRIPNKNMLNYGQQLELKDYIRSHARMITIAKDGTHLDELKSRISHIYLRRVKEDLANMVNKTVHEEFYILSAEQKQKYDKLWEEYENAQLELDPSKELNKELLEGGLYRRYLSNEMVPNTIKLVDKIIANGDKVVIACCYDEELYSLSEYYKDRCVIYNGKITAKQKDYNVEQFQNNPDIMVFIGNINAAGVGISLTVSHNLVFNNMSFVPGDNRQMEDRVCRLTSTKDVNIYYQLFLQTQYEKMWNIVLKKELMINKIIKKESEK